VSRTSRFLKGFGLGYFNLVAMTVAGLFLTRFYLHHLGQVSYGYWLVASQLLGFAALLDLGVVAILPREIAYLTGSTSAQPQEAQKRTDLLEGVSGLVLLQMPLVFLLLVCGWLLLPSSWETLRWPLALLLTSFLLSFPLRIPTAILTGLQDLGFLSLVQLVTWIAGTLLTVVLVGAGWGLDALALGYVATQASASLWSLIRLRRRWPQFVPRRAAWPDSRSTRYIRSSVWAILGSLAVVFIFGTESLVIGTLFGAAIVVPYSTTGKLLSVLGNQPNLVMQTAAPGLSETRTATDGPTRLNISVALAQGMLTLTAVIIVVVLAINEGFVSWWLGPQQYAGLLLTLLMAARLFLRNWNTTLVYTLFSFGHERRIALVNLADGGLTVILSVVLAQRLGLIGVPLGSLLAVLLVSLPLNIRGIHHDTGISSLRVAAAHAWWQPRFLVLAAAAAVASRYWNDSRLPSVLVKGVLALAGCAALLGPLALRPPLAAYVRPRLEPLLARLRPSRTGSA
jgi:O-antigen/teichoic acid export membrane protein